MPNDIRAAFDVPLEHGSSAISSIEGVVNSCHQSHQPTKSEFVAEYDPLRPLADQAPFPISFGDWMLTFEKNETGYHYFWTDGVTSKKVWDSLAVFIAILGLDGGLTRGESDRVFPNHGAKYSEILAYHAKAFPGLEKIEGKVGFGHFFAEHPSQYRPHHKNIIECDGLRLNTLSGYLFNQSRAYGRLTFKEAELLSKVMQSGGEYASESALSLVDLKGNPIFTKNSLSVYIRRINGALHDLGYKVGRKYRTPIRLTRFES